MASWLPLRWASSFFFCCLMVLIVHSNTEAVVLTSVDKFIDKVYPERTNIASETVQLTDEQLASIEEKGRVSFQGRDTSFTFHKILQAKNIIGIVSDIRVKGKWGIIHFAVAVNSDRTVKRVTVLEYKEVRGKPTKKRRFLKQYDGKGLHDPLRLNRDIKGITGATISSRGITNGVRKMVYMIDEVYGGELS